MERRQKQRADLDTVVSAVRWGPWVNVPWLLLGLLGSRQDKGSPREATSLLGLRGWGTLSTRGIKWRTGFGLLGKSE